MTTLDYEWSIIRRRRPYQWTIWVSSNAYFGLCHPAQFVLIPSSAVLPYTCDHPFSYHTSHYSSRRYNTIQLPGRWRTHSTSHLHLTNLDSQAATTLQLVSMISNAPPSPEKALSTLLSSCFQIFAYTAFTAASFLVVLRMYVCFHTSEAADISPEQQLMAAASVAIWNKNKVISGIAIGLWLNNTAFCILCKFLPLTLDGIRNLMCSWFDWA